MIRLLAPLAVIVSLGLAAEQQAGQEAGAFAQVPLASVQQPQLPQYFFNQQQQAFPAAQQQQFVQYQTGQQFYYPQQVQAQQQAFYYPYQAFQQYAPVQPAFQMSPKLTIPTGLLRKHLNASSDEPSVFAMSYNPETGVKVATINGKKVFAYKQRFPGAPKEDVEIVENGEINASGTPTVVASTTENEAGEKTKNVFFDDRDDPMVKIEKEPVAVATTTVNPNLPVVNQDGDEATTVAGVPTTTVVPSTTVGVAAGAVTVTPVPVVGDAVASVTSTAVPVAVGAEAVVATTTAAPVVPTTPVIPSEAFFAAQNPMYMANVAAFAGRYPQYFPTRFAAPGKSFPAPFTAVQGQQAQPQYAAFPSTVAPASFAAAGGLQIGSGLSQVHPVYAQSAISTTPFPQAAAQYVARPVPVAFAQPRPVYVPHPTAVPQGQYFQSTPVPVATAQQQYLSPAVPQQQYLQPTTAQPIPQQYLQPVQQQAQPQYVQQQPQQYLQPTRPQAVPQYQQPTAQQPQYYPQAQPTPVPQQPQYVQQQPVRQHQYQQPRYPAPTAPTRHQYFHPPPPASPPAYNDVERPAPPPQDFTDEELRPTEPESEPIDHNAPAASTMPPGMSPDDRYHAPTHYQQATGYTTPEPENEHPSSPPRYQPAPTRYVERPAENERYPEPTSTPGYDAPETTTYTPRPAPSRRPYAPQRPTSSYSRPAAYRQQPYRAQPVQRPAPVRYNPNRKVTYYQAGSNRRVQAQPAYNRNSNSYAAPRAEDSAATQSNIADYVPSPAYRQHGNGYARPQPSYTSQPAHQAQPQYAAQNTYNRPAQYPAATTEEPAPAERYYARVNNDDQSKVNFSENPFDKMEFLSTPFPAGQKKDVKVTFINRHRTA